MKALSLSQPWCWAVVHPDVRKHIENRSWAPPISMIDQTIAIHAAKSWDDKKDYRYIDPGKRFSGIHTPIGYLLACGFSFIPARRELYATSAIVAVATIDRVVTKADTLPEEQRKWFFGPYGWVLKNVRRLETPIPCGGKQGLWTVPPELEPGIEAQLPRAA